MENLVTFINIFVPISLGIFMIYILYKEKDIIKFKTLKLPKEPYLKGKYVRGLKYKSGNMFITCGDNDINISIENKDGVFNQTIKNIKEIKIDIKPYNYVKETVDGYETDYVKSAAVGRMTGDFTKKNKITVLKSFEITIITDNETIELITFKDPKYFFRR